MQSSETGGNLQTRLMELGVALPLTACPLDLGSVLDANGKEFVTADVNGEQTDAFAFSLASAVADAVNALFHAPAPPPQEHVTGVELAARFVERRLKEYVDEFGSTDPETGTVEFPSNGDEYVGELEEIIEGIRKLGTNHGCKSDLHPEYVTPAGDA